MKQSKEQNDLCPECRTKDKVYSKLILIEDILKPDTARDRLRIDHLQKEFLGKAPLEQFIEGFFCEKCGCGFIPNNYLKSKT